MQFKLKSIKIVPNDKGIQEILKGDQMRDDLLNYGKKIASELNDVTDSEVNWDASIHERSKRLVVNVTNDDPEVKWKEVEDGKVAKYIARKKYKGKRK